MTPANAGRKPVHIKWDRQGRVHLLLDVDGWCRCVVLKEASWVVIGPLGIPRIRPEELIGYPTLKLAKKAASIVWQKATGGSK